MVVCFADEDEICYIPRKRESLRSELFYDDYDFAQFRKEAFLEMLDAKAEELSEEEASLTSTENTSSSSSAEEEDEDSDIDDQPPIHRNPIQRTQQKDHRLDLRQAMLVRRTSRRRLSCKAGEVQPHKKLPNFRELLQRRESFGKSSPVTPQRALRRQQSERTIQNPIRVRPSLVRSRSDRTGRSSKNAW